MRFLIISILLSVISLVGHSADSTYKIVSTLDFNSEAYQRFFQYAESIGITKHDLIQNFRGLSASIISDIMKDEGIDLNIRDTIKNTVNILNIPTHVSVQDRIAAEDFEKLNTLIIDVITIHYKAAFKAKYVNNNYAEEPMSQEASNSISSYYKFINSLVVPVYMKEGIDLLPLFLWNVNKKK